MSAAPAPAIPQSGAAPETWDSAELPAPVPHGCGAEPRVTAHLFAPRPDPAFEAITREAFAPLAAAMMARPALQANLTPNQLALKIGSAFMDLDRLIPRHEAPLPQTADFKLLLQAQAGDIAQALTALLELTGTEEPEPDAE